MGSKPSAGCGCGDSPCEKLFPPPNESHRLSNFPQIRVGCEATGQYRSFFEPLSFSGSGHLLALYGCLGVGGGSDLGGIPWLVGVWGNDASLAAKSWIASSKGSPSAAPRGCWEFSISVFLGFNSLFSLSSGLAFSTETCPLASSSSLKAFLQESLTVLLPASDLTNNLGSPAPKFPVFIKPS